MGEKLRSDRFLEKKNIKLIVHSPLQRARKTCHGVLGFVAPEIESKDTDNSFELSTAGDKGRVVQLDALKERTPKEWLPFSKESYEGRIKSVVQWLIRQEEDVVAVVGHSQFFKTMLGLDYKFGNCDVYEVILDHTGDMDNDAHNMDERNIHGWRDLKQLYSL
jgi:broad specificity phosphatase PhoE